MVTSPVEEEKLDKISGAIFDKIADISERSQYCISIKQIIDQLSQWNIFDPIPNPQERIYNGIYRRLSSDVHVIPDKIDIGRYIAQEERLFEQRVLRETLREYSLELLEIMDIAIVTELNIMKDIIMQNTQSQLNLEGRLDILNQLGLKYSCSKGKILIEQG